STQFKPRSLEQDTDDSRIASLDAKSKVSAFSFIVSPPSRTLNPPLVQCTSHMCLIRVHSHIKLQYKEYWRIKIT
ncbi:hypothetical protein S245_049581, partial [Arachis hypogaea]